MEQIPCKLGSLRLILIYHFACVARKQDTVNVRWLSRYVECSDKPGNPLGTGICMVGFMSESNKTQKGNKLAGGSVTKNPTLVRHPSLGIYSFNTSLTTSTQNGSKNLQCQLGCAQQLLPVQSVWDGCKRSVAQSPHEVSVFSVFRIVK